MELNREQVEFIQHDIRSRGILLDDLAESFLDHICCVIENSDEKDFTSAYANAIAQFGEQGLLNIQKETILIITLKKQFTMKKTMFVLGYIAVFFCTSGFLFKMQHWPGASVMLVMGVVLLNFGFLPMYFLDKYKSSKLAIE